MGEDVRNCVFDIDVDRFVEDWSGCSSGFEDARQDFLDEGGDVGVFISVAFGGFFGMGIGFEVGLISSDGGSYSTTALVPKDNEKG